MFTESFGHTARSWAARCTPAPRSVRFQPCVAHYDRAAPTAAHLQERIRGVQFDDDDPLAGLSKVIAEQTADIAQPADHDVAPHQRDAELLKPIVKQQGQPAQRGVTGHDRREDPSDLDRDR